MPPIYGASSFPSRRILRWRLAFLRSWLALPLGLLAFRRRPNTLLLDNALATMGAGLPFVIAARLVHPRRKVLALGNPDFVRYAEVYGARGHRPANAMETRAECTS